jgi:hypothetical protein
MNEALLIKHLHKFYNKEDVPWVQLIWNSHYLDGQIPHACIEKGSFWFRDIMKYYDHFRGIALATIGLEDTVLLWGDVWNGHHLCLSFQGSFLLQKIRIYRWQSIAATQGCIKTFILLCHNKLHKN